MPPRRRPEDPETVAREALASAERDARAKPGDQALQLRVAEGSLRLGDVLQQQGMDEAAGRCFERARRIADAEFARTPRQAEPSGGSAREHSPARRVLADAWLAIGSNRQARGMFPEAAEAYRRTLDLLGPLPRDERHLDRGAAERVANAHGNLAVALDESDQSEDAFGHYRLALGIAEAVHRAHRDRRAAAALALAHNGIAHHYGETGRFVDAAQHHEASRAINARLLDETPDDEHVAYCLATDHENLCDLAWRREDLEAAVEHGRRALDLRAELCDRHGASVAPEWLEQLGDSHRDVAELLQELGRRDEAIRHHRAARRIAEQLRATWPEEEDFQFRVADSLLMLGDALEENGELEEALATYRAAREADRELVEAQPDVVRWHANAAHCELRMAVVLVRLGRHEEAQRSVEAGLRTLGDQIAAHPGDRSLLHDSSNFHADIANAWLNVAMRENAEHHLRASLRIDRKLLQDRPDDENTLAHLAITYDTLAALREEVGDFEAARKFCVLAVRAEESLIARDPESSEYQLRLGQALLNLASVQRGIGNDDEAMQTLRKAQSAQKRLHRLMPEHVEVHGLGGQVERVLGTLLRDGEDLAGARAALDRSVTIFDELRTAGARVANLDNHLADALESRLEIAVDEFDSAPIDRRAEAEAELESLLERAIELRRELARQGTDGRAAGDSGGDVLAWRDLARLLELGSEGLEAAGRYDDAQRLRREADEIHLRYGRDS